MRKCNVFMCSGEVVEVEFETWECDGKMINFYNGKYLVASFNQPMVQYIVKKNEKDEYWLNGAELKIILNSLNDRLHYVKALGFNYKYYDSAIDKIEKMLEDMKL